MLQFKLIWVVQSSHEKSSACAVGQITFMTSPRFFPARGAFRDRHERWVRNAVDEQALLDGRWLLGRRSRVVLAPRRWCQVGDDAHPSWPATGARKPGPREEYEGNRKTIAQGMPVDFGVPVVTTLVCFLHLRTRLWVLAEHPAFPAPSFPGGRYRCISPGTIRVAGPRGCVLRCLGAV
jgi:hypothetical protein